MRISDWSSDVCSSDLDGPFGAFVGQDDKDPETYILSFYQSGLGMPDRDYYLDQSDRMKQTRAAYVAHLEKMFTLAGEPNGSARSEEHTSELQSLMRISYAVFCLKKKKNKNENTHQNTTPIKQTQ